MEIAKADIVLNIKSDLSRLEKEITKVSKEFAKVEKSASQSDNKVGNFFIKLGSYFTQFKGKLTGAGNLLRTVADQADEFISKIKSKVENKLGNGGDFLRGLGDTSDDIINQIADKIGGKWGDWLKNKLGGVGDFMRGLGNTSDEVITSLLANAQSKLGVVGNILRMLGGSSDKLASKLGWISQVGNLFKDLGSGLNGFIGSGGNLGKMISSIDSIGSAFTKVLGPVSNFFTTTKAHYQDKLAKANEALKKEMMLLQMQSEAEKEYQNFKREQEAEEFQRKYGLREEEYLQMDERAQKEFADQQGKQAEEELLNLKAVRSREERNQKIAELEKKQAEKEKEMKSKQFKADKANNIINTIISTAKGIAGIWASELASKGIFGIATASLLTALLSTKAGIEIGTITSQKNPYAYRQGGIALSDQFSRLGEAGPEMVLPPGLSNTLLALNEHYQKLSTTTSPNLPANALSHYDNRTFNISVVKPPNVEDFVREVQDELGRGIL